MIRNVLGSEVFEDLSWFEYPGTNGRTNFIYLIYHATNDTSSIDIKLWFEHFRLVEKNE